MTAASRNHGPMKFKGWDGWYISTQHYQTFIAYHWKKFSNYFESRVTVEIETLKKSIVLFSFAPILEFLISNICCFFSDQICWRCAKYLLFLFWLDMVEVRKIFFDSFLIRFVGGADQICWRCTKYLFFLSWSDLLFFSWSDFLIDLSEVRKIFVVSFLIRFVGGAQNICCFFSDQICWRCASPKCSRSSESIAAAKICQTAKNGKIGPKEPVISKIYFRPALKSFWY